MNDVPTVLVTDVPDDAFLLDVREADEWVAGHAPDAVHVPLAEVPSRLSELPEGPVHVICRSGARSGRAVQWLVANGHDAVNVSGGMHAWAAAGRPMTASGDAEPRVA